MKTVKQYTKELNLIIDKHNELCKKQNKFYKEGGSVFSELFSSKSPKKTIPKLSDEEYVFLYISASKIKIYTEMRNIETNENQIQKFNNLIENEYLKIQYKAKTAYKQKYYEAVIRIIIQNLTGIKSAKEEVEQLSIDTDKASTAEAISAFAEFINGGKIANQKNIEQNSTLTELDDIPPEFTDNTSIISSLLPSSNASTMIVDNLKTAATVGVGVITGAAITTICAIPVVGPLTSKIVSMGACVAKFNENNKKFEKLKSFVNLMLPIISELFCILLKLSSYLNDVKILKQIDKIESELEKLNTFQENFEFVLIKLYVVLFNVTGRDSQLITKTEEGLQPDIQKKNSIKNKLKGFFKGKSIDTFLFFDYNGSFLDIQMYYSLLIGYYSNYIGLVSFINIKFTVGIDDKIKEFTEKYRANTEHLTTVNNANNMKEQQVQDTIIIPL